MLMKDTHLTQFTDLGLDAALLKALDGEGYTTPTPIQAKAIPSVMAGKDLLGIAQTGTGKTAAFALPILHRLAANKRAPLRKGCRCLVLSPTRELASQIAESFKTYGRHLGVTVAVVFGGVGHKPQRDALNRGVDVLVATPGRLLDHMGARDCDVSGTEIFVLDEADQMLDLGFVVPIRRIVKHLSQRRQNLFFSATMPSEIGKLAGELLIDPVKVAVTPVATTAERVAQRVIHVSREQKTSMLAELFADAAIERALVFTRTKRGADRVARKLEATGVPVASIHGNKSQRQREIALADFKSSRIRALVATDIAARGIDVEGVSHVINFELPNVPESYVHRIGRTARAGAEGVAISLCEGEENDYLRDIERLIRQKIPAEDRRNDATLAREAVKGDAGRRDGGRQGRGDGGRQRRDGQRGEPRRHGDNRMAEARNGEERRPHPHRDQQRPRPAGDEPSAGGHGAHGYQPRGPRPERSGERPQGERGSDRHRNGHQHRRHDGPRHDRGGRDFVNELAFGATPRPPGHRDTQQGGGQHEHRRPDRNDGSRPAHRSNDGRNGQHGRGDRNARPHGDTRRGDHGGGHRTDGRGGRHERHGGQAHRHEGQRGERRDRPDHTRHQGRSRPGAGE
jgi:ATP-dependent RNA helicase RhlE